MEVEIHPVRRGGNRGTGMKERQIERVRQKLKICNTLLVLEAEPSCAAVYLQYVFIFLESVIALCTTVWKILTVWN